jgi:two-component system sensor histidine kinase/response regulator
MTLFSGRAPTFLAPETTVIFSGEAVAMRSEDGSRHDWMSRVVHDMMHSGKEYYFIKDIDLIYRGCSDSFARLIGLRTAEEIDGKSDYDIYPREIAEKYRAADREVLRRGQPVDGDAEQLSNGTAFIGWTKTWKNVIHDETGRIVGIYGVSYDVTQMMSLEEEAAHARKNAALIRNLPGGVGILHEKDGEFWLDFANDGWARAHHISENAAGELLGKTTTALIYEPDRERLHREFERIERQEGKQGELLYRIYGADGQLHWITVQFRFAYQENGIRYYYASYTNMDGQKAAEAELAGNQSALQEVVENSDIQFFTYFPGKHRCELYAVNKRLRGLPMLWENFPEDFLPYTHASAADAQNYREMLKKIDEGAEFAECVMRFYFRGAPIWEHVCIRSVRDGQGRTVKGLGYSMDITARKAAEEQLEKQRMRFRVPERDVLETVSYNITQNTVPEVLPENSELLHGAIRPETEREALRIYPPVAGLNRETRQILLRIAERIPDPDHRALFLRTCGGEAVDRAVRDGKTHEEIRYRRQVNNMLRWVSTRMEVLPDPETGDMLAFFYTRDVTDEVILQEMNQRIVEINYLSVAVCDLQTGKLLVKSAKTPVDAALLNVRYEDALNAEAEETENSAVFLENLSLQKITGELERSPVYSNYYVKRATRADLPGNPRQQVKNDVFYLDENRDVLVFLLTDVTEIFQQDRKNREQMQAALAAAKQASAAKSNFLSRMSHEIRTPLNAIIGMDTIAAQTISNPERVADCISKIGISARYLLSLINDILDMSRIESGKMLLKNEKFLFRDFIGGINNMIYNQASSKGLDYECTVNSEISEAYIGDPMKLQQVLINVLGNAVKFTRTGKVTLSIHPISHRGGQSVVRFTVNDTGVGIREEFLEKIFEPFEQSDTSTTTAFGGTGLGLAITKNLVSLMGGTIHVRSIVDVGSEFTVDIPLTVDESVLVQPKLEMHFEKMHTLIVDDDLVICEQTESILKSIGMYGEWVTSGAEAVERVKRSSEKSAFYDFILVDWKMPDMDGLETTRQIRRIVGPDVTIIIITAYDWESIEIEAKAAGANLLISKPLLRSTLVSAFEKARGIAEAEHPQEPAFDFTGKRVLVAEDNAINAEIAKCLLENKNFTVELASNGQKALELYTGHPDYYYDAILMDIRMPLMDGLQTTTNIRHWNRADAKTIPIIAMTANAFDEDVDKSKAAGMNAHLSKPIDPNLLYGTLYRIFTEEQA